MVAKRNLKQDSLQTSNPGQASCAVPSSDTGTLRCTQIYLTQKCFTLTPFKFMKYTQTLSTSWPWRAAKLAGPVVNCCVFLHNQIPHRIGGHQSLSSPSYLATQSAFPPKSGNLLTPTKRWSLLRGHKVVQAQLFLSYGVSL